MILEQKLGRNLIVNLTIYLVHVGFRAKKLKYIMDLLIILIDFIQNIVIMYKMNTIIISVIISVIITMILMNKKAVSKDKKIIIDSPFYDPYGYRYYGHPTAHYYPRYGRRSYRHHRRHY